MVDEPDAPRKRGRPGRKRDHSRDGPILDATLRVLADAGYDGMTIDTVAARAGSARATVYRRWATKADLVLDAVAQMSAMDVDLDHLPDTGSLRGDIVAMILPQTTEEQQLRIKVMSALLAATDQDARFAKAATGAGIGPWIDASRLLMHRAVKRGEFPPADVDTLAEVVPMMCICRVAIQQEPITREFSLALLDGVILPAMRGGS